MNKEIEAKFLNVNHDQIRKKLSSLGAVLEQPMRTMRRVVIHTPDMTKKNAFVRVRDEGYRTTMTYKQFDHDSVDGAKEYEIQVDNFDTAVSLLGASGLKYDTYQETKRENWRLDNTEIMLDEWPWLNPYIEIESRDESMVKDIALKLGFSWKEAIFGGVANAYQKQYPHIDDAGKDEINQKWSIIKFDEPAPGLISNN